MSRNVNFLGLDKMQLSSAKVGFAVLIFHIIVASYVCGETHLKGASPPASQKREADKSNVASEREDALMKAIEKGIFARRSVSSQPPGVWGRSIESSMKAREAKRDFHILRPQSPAERRALQDSIHHLLQAKEALDDLTKRISQPPGVWGKRMASQPPGVWGKRNVRTQPPGVWGKRSMRTQPPGVWGKRSSELFDRGYNVREAENAEEDDEIDTRSALVRQPPGVWGRRDIELAYRDEQ